MNEHFTIALAGCPNVGKSTVFNALTGMKQHTGNWAGKTVSCAEGCFRYGDKQFTLADIPGMYSLYANSAEEAAARDFICSENADAAIVVCDASCLERNLYLVLQIMEIIPRTLVCVNLVDEAEKKGIHIDGEKLRELLGVPVVLTSARSKVGLDDLCRELSDLVSSESSPQPTETGITENIDDEDKRRETLIDILSRKAAEIAAEAVICDSAEPHRRDRILDRLFVSPKSGIPIMLLLFGLIMWITIVGANYPSELLSRGLFSLGDFLSESLLKIGAPQWVEGILIQGVYKVSAWVISVMLPPMAIFFPLFTLLEDFGYLPRLAFNLDRCFKCAGACGKQAITMAMGLGCNACGVTGCRIIDSPRERMIAIITNNFIPCNGRFPTIIAIIAMFFITVGGAAGGMISAAILLTVILVGVLITLLTSFLLSKTLLKGHAASYTLELPPYRAPQIGKVLIRSLLDRTVFVLARACTAAIPCGMLIWILANIRINDISILSMTADFLEPLGNLMGLDGVIIMAFILGFPANEIVVPIILMTYLSHGSLIEISDRAALSEILTAHGWTLKTAVCMVIFTLFHFPCATTCMTIRKETGSLKWTAVSFLLPTLIGIILCVTANFMFSVFT